MAAVENINKMRKKNAFSGSGTLFPKVGSLYNCTIQVVAYVCVCLREIFFCLKIDYSFSCIIFHSK